MTYEEKNITDIRNYIMYGINISSTCSSGTLKEFRIKSMLYKVYKKEKSSL